MQNILLRILGLGDLAKTVTLLKAELDGLKSELETLDEKVDEIEIPDEIDTDDFVREDDFDDKVKDIIRDEVADKDDIVKEAYEELEGQVEELVEDEVKKAIKNVDKASFGDEEELKTLIRSVILDRVSIRIEVQ